MSRLLALLLVCALLPRPGLTQDTPAPTPTDETLVAPPLVPAPEHVEPEPLAPPKPTPTREEKGGGMPTLPRIVLETLAGGAGMVVGGLLGAFLGIATSDCAILEGDCSSTGVLALAGMSLGATSATYATGTWMKGEGSLLGSFIGGALGTCAGLLIVGSNGPDEAAGAIALFSLPAIGAVAGYELGRFAQPDTGFSLTEGRVRLMPAVSASPGGGVMGGLVGRF
ncbi:hypothetical protein [Pyxidicoccus xibeiensis]|uniref:hypothetical protein n=1 Tax=Pyxidicoccus xibeiensis TaxID=2906759 RepID=UPI0020A6E0E0|nr:hypothetical protein [Pyxidicoccus xibeiensis]MCP3140894.1 hypothetical protein [Pyxidicoccus xibeiensis]